MKSPSLAADIIIRYPDNQIVLVKRKYKPFEGHWALPGGGVEIGETVEQAAVREAKEETGLIVKLERLAGVYSEPDRDPRGHVVSVVFLAIPVGGELDAASDAAEVIKTGDFLEMNLAFDHQRILSDILGS